MLPHSRETQSETKLYEEPKYIVFESCLTELFKTCRECFQPCRCSFTTSGTLVTVLAECHQGHTFQWTSQPHIGKKAAGNALLSAALLYSGSSPTCTLRMLRQMRVQVLTDRQYYRYQGAYLFPTVNKVYKQQQQGLLEDLGTDPTSLASDGRCDSPGHSAKFLTYSFYSDRLNKIIHFEQVQVKESTEVQASSHMEKEGLVRGLKFMEDNHVHVASLTTDRHPATKKYMRTAKPGIKHYFDVWHVSKGGDNMKNSWIQPTEFMKMKTILAMVDSESVSFSKLGIIYRLMRYRCNIQVPTCTDKQRS
ncbi:uncharacterized protein LOC135374375 [Ornithodoros turicata]|uniref:uncharacterized protein LOC135374375 n=1 Tax=Ornithodoros turicata TaxID=34597 RepID=UPI00313A1B33